MRVNRILNYILLAGGILLAGTSCTREELDIRAQEEKDRVPITLSLSVAGMEAGTPETKAIMEPDIPGVETIEEQIDNIVVLQFEGTGNNAKLIGLPVYYKDAAKIFDGTEQVRLLPSSKPNIIVVVANTFDNIFAQNGMTLQQFLNGDYTRMSDYNSVFTEKSGNEYLRMSGAKEMTSIGTGTPVDITLKRNVSKVTINVTNNTGSEEVKISLKQTQIRDINAKYYYLTNISSFADAYSAADPSRFDKEPEEWPEGETTRTFTYYIPVNLRGSTNSSAQYTKGLGAPEGATRFCLYGTYGSDDTPINYTYYLGGNLVNDFDLKPNYHYTYNISINSKGDDRYDYRIEDCKEVKFKTDANCYMVQPPQGKDQFRIYAIPIRRAAIFWNNASNFGVYGASGYNDGKDYSSYTMGSGTKWTVDILWSDFPLDSSDFLEKSSGTGYDPEKEGHDAYFKIKVREGMKGNVVVAVRAGNSSSIFWSWHIWITDYNPDRENLTPASGTLVYGVDGGNVHRYGTQFNSAYRNGFIMDRNLGASGVAYEENMGTMYYQFGRKDPFLGQTQKGEFGKWYIGGNDLRDSKSADYVKNKGETGEPNKKNARYAVCNPMVFIAGEDDSWTVEDALADIDGHLWFDPRSNEHTTAYDLLLEKNKSIYDPCPPGWKVPVSSIFNDLNSEGRRLFGSAKGVTYKNSAFYPAVSNLRPANGTMTEKAFGSVGYYWTANPGRAVSPSSVPETGTSYVFNLDSKETVTRTNIYQATAQPVRCVREEKYEKENYIVQQ